MALKPGDKVNVCGVVEQVRDDGRVLVAWHQPIGDIGDGSKAWCFPGQVAPAEEEKPDTRSKKKAAE